MSLPHFDFPDSPHLAGDAKDDDARVLDSLVESHAQPPDAKDLPLARVEPLIVPPRLTRLMTGSMNISKDWPEPVQLLPSDPNRVALTINMNSTTALDVLLFADEKNKCQTAMNAFTCSPATRAFSLGEHTGALWAWGPGLAATALVSWVAVTK